MKTNIRLMEEGDLPRVVAVENRWSYLSKWGEEGYRAVVRNPGIYTCLVAEVTQPEISTEPPVIVGVAVLGRLIDHSELCNIVVTPEYLSKKVGAQLLQQCMEICEYFRIPRMLLEVRQSNRRAIHFYEKNGFRVISQRKNYYLNPKEDAWVMERDLSATNDLCKS